MVKLELENVGWKALPVIRMTASIKHITKRIIPVAIKPALILAPAISKTSNCWLVLQASSDLLFCFCTVNSFYTEADRISTSRKHTRQHTHLSLYYPSWSRPLTDGAIMYSSDIPLQALRIIHPKRSPVGNWVYGVKIQQQKKVNPRSVPRTNHTSRFPFAWMLNGSNDATMTMLISCLQTS